jgi:phosphotransferase family protein
MEITPQMRSMFDKMFDHIIEKNLAQSFVYVHRDYMPRNLMLEEKDNPGIIDFQDAVYGPVSYDIACLCRDAFISWSEAQILDWTIRYWDKARKEGIPVPADFGVFWEDVEWMALQRHLKVLGIFARLNYRDGKTKYLGDTPRFLNYVQKTASRFDALRPLSRFINQISGIEETVGYSF